MNPLLRRRAVALCLAVAVGACTRRTPAPQEAPSPAPTPVPSRIVLFFPGADGLLHAEAREVAELPAALVPRIRILVEELAFGSQQGWAPVFPWPVAVLGAFADEAHNAYVDLSPPPPGAVQGSAGEAALLYATISTVVANCPGLVRVQLLFDGNEVPTLGHLDFSRPLAPQPGLVAR